MSAGQKPETVKSQKHSFEQIRTKDDDETPCEPAGGTSVLLYHASAHKGPDYRLPRCTRNAQYFALVLCMTLFGFSQKAQPPPPPAFLPLLSPPALPRGNVSPLLVPALLLWTPPLQSPKMPPQLPPPLPAKPDVWTKVDGVDCLGKSAVSMEHKKSEPCCSTASVRDCMDKCVEIVRCTAITVRRVPDSGAYECFRKKIIDAGACFASASHDTNLFFFFLRFFVGVCKARLWFFFFFLDFFIIF